MQIQPIIKYSEKKKVDFFDNKFDVSYLCFLKKNVKDIKITMLKEHYRCAPQIINFCNKFFYNNELIIHTEYCEEPNMFYIDSTIENNENKEKQSIHEFSLIDMESSDSKDIGYISPYKSKRASTVHTYQGRENNEIYFMFSSTRKTSFNDNINLINVAVSRAKNKFTFISKDFSADKFIIGDLIKYIKYSDPKNNIYEKSVFEILSKNKNAIRYKKTELSPAEKPIDGLLKKLLSESKYAFYTYLHNYFLKNLTYDKIDLKPEEKNFINTDSHIDFLIVSSSNMQPILAIEVDGHSFHNSADSHRRDTLKTNILKKINIPLLRLNTKTSTNEIERIKKALDLK